MKKNLLLFTLFLLCSCFGFSQQDTAKVNLVQFSGIVVEGDSMLGTPGVHIFNPKSKRGTSTNLLGYFSLPVKPGDSLLIAAVGFQKQYYEVPKDSINNFTVVIRLHEDTVMLPLIDIIPFPSERVFKEAFLALNIPMSRDEKNINKNLNQQILERMYMTLEDDGSMNHSYYMNQQLSYMEQRYMYRTSISLLDPFAWARFFKDQKSEKEKREEAERIKRNNSGY